MAFLKTNDLLNAFEHLNYAVELDTTSRSFFWLGNDRCPTRQFSKSYFLLKKANELNPGSIESLINLGSSNISSR